MGDVVHVSRIKIVREKGPTRRAMIEGSNYITRCPAAQSVKACIKLEDELILEM